MTPSLCPGTTAGKKKNAAAPELLLDVRDLHAGYGRAEVLHGLDIQARAGQVILAVGRALMGKPRLLMLDEPSLGLAPRLVRDIFATIAALRGTGVTILLVEQNARAALEVADHGYVLEMGEIALQGPAAELARDPRVVETYLGASRRKGGA